MLEPSNFYWLIYIASLSLASLQPHWFLSAPEALEADSHLRGFHSPDLCMAGPLRSSRSQVKYPLHSESSLANQSSFSIPSHLFHTLLPKVFKNTPEHDALWLTKESTVALTWFFKSLYGLIQPNFPVFFSKD